MFHEALLAMNLISCNPYTDGWCYRPAGGYVSQIAGSRYGYPLPGLLSDFLEPDGFRFSQTELQAAIDDNPYLIVQTRLPIQVETTIRLSGGHHIIDGVYIEGLPGSSAAFTIDP